MKHTCTPRLTRAALIATITAGSTIASAAVTVAAGPYFNATTGSRYYRIAGGDWNSLRAFALQMGGDLATIEDAAENTWVRSTIVGSTNKPFIGLNDAATEGTFGWADGSTSSYRNWSGLSVNSATKDYVRYDGQASGTWEVVTVAFSVDAIVEIKPVNGQQAPIRVPSERATLPEAMAAATATGATRIEVAAGTYNLSTYISTAAVEILGVGPGLTVFQGPSVGYAFALTGTASLRDCTVVNRSSDASVALGSGTPMVRGVEFTSLPGTADAHLLNLMSTSGRPTVDRCVFNTSQFALRLYDGAATFTNCIFRDLGGITTETYAYDKSIFSNCVFTRCGPTQLFDNGGAVSVANSIFWDNSGAIGTPTVSYSIAPVSFGPTNLNSNPLFVDAPANDFRLQAGSPCIDRGSIGAFFASVPPDLIDAAGGPRVVDVPAVANVFSPLSPIDIGAFEWAPIPCPGDLNGDGTVADDDFTIFLAGYNQLVCP